MCIRDRTKLSGEQLEQALVSRGFVVEDRIDAPLTVLTGNPCFGPVGWENTLAPTVIGLDVYKRQELLLVD